MIEMLNRQKRLLISSILFIAIVLVFTRVDYLIHSDLYGSGLEFSYDWFWTSQILYSMMYQVVIVMLFLYSRSIRLLMILEAFSIPGSQDIVFFGLWNGGVFPTSTWTWNPFYVFFGFNWTTMFQLWLSAVAVGVTTFVALYFNPDKGRNWGA